MKKSGEKEQTEQVKKTLQGVIEWIPELLACYERVILDIEYCYLSDDQAVFREQILRFLEKRKETWAWSKGKLEDISKEL